MSEVCQDTELEHILTTLFGEELPGRTSSNSNDAG